MASSLFVIDDSASATEKPLVDNGSPAYAPVSVLVERVSVSSKGLQGNSDSTAPSISSNGRYVAFYSGASNLVSGDTNNASDVFVYDRSTDKVERVSISNNGTQANSDAYDPHISANGRYVAFYSNASNLVAGDTNATSDVFVYDRNTDKIERISVSSNGTQANGYSFSPELSSNGRYVAYGSWATNLVSGDTNGNSDIFVYDRNTDKVERVSLSSSGVQANADAYDPSISADGRYVVYQSEASNLVAGDTNGVTDIFVYDRKTDTTERVSVASNGAQANSFSLGPEISANGRYVTFYSDASNLVPGDTNGMGDIFVYDRKTDTIERVSVASNGAQANESSLAPDISSDGRYVTFHSWASNLVPGDTNDTADIFVYDRNTDSIARASVSSNGTQGNGPSVVPAISDNGGYVAYSGWASNLVPKDTNNDSDVFVTRTYDLLV